MLRGDGCTVVFVVGSTGGVVSVKLLSSYTFTGALLPGDRCSVVVVGSTGSVVSVVVVVVVAVVVVVVVVVAVVVVVVVGSTGGACL